MTSLTKTLASYIEQARFSDFPKDVVQKAKECFLDSLGASLAGSQIVSSQLAAQHAQNVFGGGRARILGTDVRVHPVGAAWANATSHSALDIDDSHSEAIGHPGAVIFPAALAFAQCNTSIDGKHFLEAAILAYEVSIRISKSRSREKRFSFTTGSWGAYASAIAVGKLIGLSREQIGHAMGIVTAHHPLPPNRRSYLHFGMVKEATGWASLTGSSAALLAKLGFSGMESILDDPEHHDASVFDDLGKNYKINKTGFKIYPSCRWNHTAIDMILALRSQYRIEPEGVKQVIVSTFLKSSQMTNAHPESIEDAQYSLPFLASIMLQHGELNPIYFSPDYLKDPKTLELASKVQLKFNPEYEALFPDKYPASVEIITEKGSFKAFADQPKGDYLTPLTIDDLRNKFKTLTHSVLKDKQSSNLIHWVLNLDGETSLERLDSFL
jgi:2-methylcitrate dehydratase PrpD